MKCGFARADITPQPGITLSGFVARCNAPSVRVRDRLGVSALYIEDGPENLLVLSHDVLGVGPELLAMLNAAISRQWHSRIPEERRLFCATHNHSAPATVTLVGCGIIEPAYWQVVVERTVAAVGEAIAGCVEAVFRHDRITAPGLNYNRRKVLDNGRVVMTLLPDRPVVRQGPAWDDFLFIRAETPGGKPIAGIVNWAAHACTVCSRDITADFPGELMRRLERRDGFPHMYLQGACGNVNLHMHDMTYEEMLKDVDAIERALPVPQWKPAGTGLRIQRDTVMLAYGPGHSRAELEATRDGMRRIADTGGGPAEHIAELANILNVPPDGTADPALLRFLAGTLRDWSERLLAGPADAVANGYPLAVAVVSLGDLALVFAAAEVFTETARRILSLAPSRAAGIVGYFSPLAGYLPTDEALKDGGYEVEYAYRFYGHPAAYAPGSESRMIRAFEAMLGSTKREQSFSHHRF